MTTQVDPEQEPRLGLIPEHLEVFDAAFPILQEVRDKTKYMYGRLPVGDPAEQVFEAYRVSPYYPNMQDDRRTGDWKVEIGTNPPARIHTELAPGGVAYWVTVGNADGKGHHQADKSEIERIAELFRYIKPLYDAEKQKAAETEQKQKPGLLRGLAKAAFGK